MAIDVACLVFCLLYMVFGYYAGGMRQIFKIAALVAASIAAIWASPIVSALMAEKFSIENVYAGYVGVAALWIGVYLLLSQFGKLFAKTLTENSERIGEADKLLGTLLGLIKAALIMLILVVVLGSFKEQIYKKRPETIELIEKSRVIRLLLKTGAAKYFLPDETLALFNMAGKAVKKKDGKLESNDIKSKELFEKPSFQEVIKDEELQRQLREGELLDVISNPKFQKLLADPEVRDQILEMGLKPGGRMPEPPPGNKEK